MITVTDYHQRTKHSLVRYARGPETLDWDDQPDPFRRYEGCPVIRLPHPGRNLDVAWADLDQSQNIPSCEPNRKNIGLLLELAFGLSAWKQYGPDRWALRCNPSSGNLHPSEAYLINGLSNELPQGLFHYVSHEHHLEQRCAFDNSSLKSTLLLGLSSIHWREAWKYGERAYRYCQHDAGHALAALSYAAAVLGWRVEMLDEYSDIEIARLLGIDRKADFIEEETESADWLCRIRYSDVEIDSSREREQLLTLIQKVAWQGKARSLGAYHMYQWPVIEEVSGAAQKNHEAAAYRQPDHSNLFPSDCRIRATQLIRQRRSAQRFNSQANSLSLDLFLRMLAATLPGNKPPFGSWNWPPSVHLCLFVHNVENLASGLYYLARSGQGIQYLKENLSAGFSWQPQEIFPGLSLLHHGDVRQAAKTLSCHQSIASDSFFSLGMLAVFRDSIDQHPWHYRRLFWECGLLGQTLYLEAEAAGVRGTGIGCFFDDDVHSILGIEGDTLQSLYHFTVGEPLEDARLETLPPYAHLSNG